MEVGGGNIEGLIGLALSRQVEFDGTVLALAVAVTGVTVPGEAHFHGVVGGEGDEAETVRYELIVQYGGVH